jgi:hypothetical protein
MPRRYFEVKAEEVQQGADYLKSIFEPFPKSFGYARWELAQSIANLYKGIAKALED